MSKPEPRTVAPWRRFLKSSQALHLRAHGKETVTDTNEVKLNMRTFTLYGECRICESPLYCIEIETGEALCSNNRCGRRVEFDPKRIERLLKKARDV